MKNVALFLLFFLFITFSQFSCHSPTAPKRNTPPDTTSNSFTWKEYTFGGQGGSSYFKDAAIVSDSNIWAVGEIYTSPDTIYNAAHWDGKQWKLRQIQFYTFCGQTHMAPYPISSVFEFKQNDVWFSDAGELVHWDGMNYQHYCSISSLINGAINKIWGTSSTDLYVVGNAGTIVHYSNGTWTKMESGTNLDIQDIWGETNPVTGKEEILAVASDPGSSYDRAILKIQGTTVSKISDRPIAYALQGIWFVPGKHYYVVGSGIYEKNMLSDSVWADSVQQITTYYTTCVRGNVINDVFIAGAFGELLHWNGAYWKSFKDQTSLYNGAYTNIAVKGNIVVAVGGNLRSGELNSEGIITIGYRY